MKDIKSFSYVDNMITGRPFEIMFGYRNQIIDKLKEYGAKAKSRKLLESANGGAWNIKAAKRSVVAVILDDLLTTDDNSPIEELIAQLIHLNTKLRAILSCNKTYEIEENSDEIYIRLWTWMLCKSAGKKAIDYALNISPNIKAKLQNTNPDNMETFFNSIKVPSVGEIVFNIGPEDILLKNFTPKQRGLKWTWTATGGLRGFKEGFYNLYIFSKFSDKSTLKSNTYNVLVHELLHLDTIFRNNLGITKQEEDTEYCRWWSNFICRSVAGEALSFAKSVENKKHTVNH